MEKKNIVLQYLRENVKYIMVSVACVWIFMAVFWLYDIPVETVVYGALLCLFLVSIVAIPDFLKFRKRLRGLIDMQKSIAVSLEKLPNGNAPMATAYQELLAILYHEKSEVSHRSNMKYTEMMEYYTLWAHQIKTPIAAMRLLLQGEENELNEELQEQLFKIEQYVEMVLQYLRIDSTSSDFVIRLYDLDEIVRQAVRKYAKLFIRKRIKLNYQELDCLVVTDKKWLLFVVEQILSNALKYTKQGEIKIYMAQDKEKMLVIEDTGIGIWPEDQPRVFEKGYTGYNGRTDKKSTGIGLYLSKSIMSKLNHGIAIASEPEKGTKVYLELRSAELQVD